MRPRRESKRQMRKEYLQDCRENENDDYKLCTSITNHLRVLVQDMSNCKEQMKISHD